MDIRHLHHFIALAEERQFTAAAMKLNIVQSGLSVTIKELEQELGVRLVNRTTRAVSLTPAGDLFLEYARATLAALQDGIQAARSQDGVVRGRLHLGILQSVAPYVNLPVLLRRFRTKYPQVEFAVRSLSTEMIPMQVRSGYLDLSFHVFAGKDDATGLKIVPFAEDSLVAICSKKHPFATRRGVSLNVLAEQPFVDLTPERALRKLVDLVMLNRGLKRDSIYEISDVHTMLHFVGENMGVAVVPSALARYSPGGRRALHVLPISPSGGRIPTWQIVIVTRAQRQRFAGKTTVDRFIEMLWEVQNESMQNPGVTYSRLHDTDGRL